MYFYTCGQTKSRKWSLRLQRSGKQEHPTHRVPTINNQSPLSIVKTVMQVPPRGRSFFDKIAGGKKYINKSAPLSTVYS